MNDQLVFLLAKLTRISRFRNLPSGTPFDDDSLSADYNIHVEFGFKNYKTAFPSTE